MDDLALKKFRKEFDDDKFYICQNILKLVEDFEKKYDARINEISIHESDMTPRQIYFQVFLKG